MLANLGALSCGDQPENLLQRNLINYFFTVNFIIVFNDKIDIFFYYCT